MRRCRKTGQVQVDMNPVNHCDPQLIDLFGAKDRGLGPGVLQGTVFQFFDLIFYYDCRESGSRWCSALTKNKTRSSSLSCAAVSYNLNYLGVNWRSGILI